MISFSELIDHNAYVKKTQTKTAFVRQIGTQLNLDSRSQALATRVIRAAYALRLVKGKFRYCSRTVEGAGLSRVMQRYPSIVIEGVVS